MIQNGVEYDLAFLRPGSWIEATGAEVGGSIHMELHEMGLDGQAKVVGIDACPHAHRRIRHPHKNPPHRGPPEMVFNLEVDAEHVYSVAGNGLLVHNTCRDSLGRFTTEAGGNTATAARGREAHMNYRNALGDGYSFEFRLPSGLRADAVDGANRIVRELKPDNPRAISDGLRQVEKYRKELESLFGGNWTAMLDTYSP